MNDKLERERTLKLFASDEEWAVFTEALPRSWHKRFEMLAKCVEIDVKERPERRQASSYLWFKIPDCRANDPSKYKTAHRRGQLVRSWSRGVKQRTDGSKAVSFSDGITWGSIGQMLGYLFGEIALDEKHDFYERIRRVYPDTDHGTRMRSEEN